MLAKRLFRFGAVFALAGYLVAVGLFFAPLSWRFPPTLVYAICPPALLAITVDLSFPTVALILAPMNALVYGVVGLVIGVIVLGVLQEVGAPS